MKKAIFLFCALGFFISMIVGSGSALAADKVQKWNCQAIFGAGDSLYKEFQAFAARVKDKTKGRLVIATHPVGSIVGYKEMHDALKTNVLQGYYCMPSFFSGKEPAFALLSDLPGGYENVQQFEDWFYKSDGLKLSREAQAKFGNYTVAIIFYGRECLPSKKAVRKLADLKGMKVRAPEGIIAELFTALGCATVSIPGGEVYSALDKGVIDAADWGTRSMNALMGLYEVCKYSIEPGFHSMSALEFTVSKRAWNKLPKDIQKIVESEALVWNKKIVARVAKEDKDAGAKLKKLGVEIISLPDGDYRKIREVARGLWSKMGNKSPLAKKVAESHIKWCQKLGLLD